MSITDASDNRLRRETAVNDLSKYIFVTTLSVNWQLAVRRRNTFIKNSYTISGTNHGDNID